MTTKAEIYKAILDIYRKTGQGFPGFLRSKIGNDLIDELIKEGKIKSVITHYSHLPNDEHLCLTKGYCVEENMRIGSDTSALYFMRIYRGLDEISRIGTNVLTLKDAIQNPDSMEKYAAWLKENHVKLTEPLDEAYDPANKVLTKNEINLLRSRTFFKEDKSLSNSISKVNKLIETEAEIITKRKDIVGLMKASVRYKKEIPKQTELLEKNNKRLKRLKSIKTWLINGKNPKQKVQDYFYSDENYKDFQQEELATETKE